ncbi:FMN-binding glutamate synthase family protein [Leptospira ilyithenensis]|uniref:FMN-binding glutamate synthase family protein n=1 Tax=Leptospira ilyithenensis TaxID=2484901 RepID=A0A4R9LUK6_9LEPT|nr:FMN-binding glutamate synthase family protein [Leptospira ilyithenensis]TGN14256.1 FMN-binding glutamate synthase family protein [Leptospira ilyithenensis]
MDQITNWISTNPWVSFGIVCISFFIVVFVRDVTQKKHTIQRNFPIVGHLRYFLEKIGPELRQYWVANDKEERPFDRTERSWIYATAKGQNNNFGFGTTELQYEPGYPIIKHHAFPFPEAKAHIVGKDPSCIPSLKVIGAWHKRKFPYRPYSIINISAMSFGSLGKNAVMALNRGARDAGAYHNTGEGGLSQYHLQGADIMWQIGTGYFGARDENGKFDLAKAKEKVEKNKNIRLIEIKLSQGAKPGKGGILPAAKVNAEIAKIRHVAIGKDCISPNSHSEFKNVSELVEFIEKVADTTGLPVGIKSAVGEIEFWEELVQVIQATGKGPDFITIDGGEGGTGAAPLTYADHVSLPFKIGFQRVYTLFQKHNLTQNIVWIGSGKLGFPDRAVVAIAMGCDLIHIAREAMLSIGCIQAQKCHTDHCPAGVATQNWWLQRGVDPEIKGKRATKYLQGFRKELLSLAHSCGYEHPLQFTGRDIEISMGMNRYQPLEDLLGYKRDPISFTKFADYTDFPGRM